jgi:hypothetical protein
MWPSGAPRFELSAPQWLSLATLATRRPRLEKRVYFIKLPAMACPDTLCLISIDIFFKRRGADTRPNGYLYHSILETPGPVLLADARRPSRALPVLPYRDLTVQRRTLLQPCYGSGRRLVVRTCARNPQFWTYPPNMHQRRPCRWKLFPSGESMWPTSCRLPVRSCRHHPP